jgi:hypothetical protein
MLLSWEFCSCLLVLLEFAVASRDLQASRAGPAVMETQAHRVLRALRVPRGDADKWGELETRESAASKVQR